MMIKNIFLFLLVIHTHSKVLQQDIDALKDIYIATNGSDWSPHQWNVRVLDNGDVCSLYGVTCNSDRSRVHIVHLRSNSLSGTIPSSIGNLTGLEELILAGNHLLGSIPHTICDLSIVTKYIELRNNSLSGTIPSCVGNLTHLTVVYLSENRLSGTIPISVSNLKLLTRLDLSNNYFNGTIPPSLFHMEKLSYLSLSNNSLSGTIPLLIETSQLSWLTLDNNSLSGTIHPSIFNITDQFQEIIVRDISHNHLSGTIPDFPKMCSVSDLFLSNNNLSGTIPSSISHLKRLVMLGISNNEHLSGTIPLSLSLLPKLTNIDLSNNSLHSDNITALLLNWFKPPIGPYQKMELISISNNENLHGDLSELEYLGDINISTHYFVAYNCDLYGSFPKNIHFAGDKLPGDLSVSGFIVHNNRLSCDIPYNLLQGYYAKNGSKNIILLSNLFVVEKMPEWITYFSTARLLYYTSFDKVISYIFAIFTGLCIITIIFKNITQMVQKLKTDSIQILMPQSEYMNQITSFLDNIVILNKYLTDFKLIIIVIPFLIFYYFNSSYFKCSTILSQLSLSYYIGYHKWCDWVLVTVLFPLFYIIIWYSVIQSQKEQMEQHQQIKQNLVPVQADKHPNKSTIVKIVWLVLFSFLFIASTVLVILSMIFESLPENNKFKLNSFSMKAIQMLMPVTLTINAAIIVPNFVDCINDMINVCIPSLSHSTFVCKYRQLSILLLRTLSTIIIPIISAIILLQNCGKNWTYFWKECNPEFRDQFEIYVDNILAYRPMSLTHWEDICLANSINNIGWNKCIRTLFANWSFVMIQKLFIMIILPFFMIFSKEFLKKIAARCGWFKKYAKTNIGIDMEYTMILTKCETMIIWGAISPFVIPLTILSIHVNYFCYKKMIDKREWKLYPYDRNVMYPIYILWISICVSQMFLCFFIFVCLENIYCGYTLLMILTFLDIIFVTYYSRYKKKMSVGVDDQGLIN